jgi:ATP-dependent DNA ligase
MLYKIDTKGKVRTWDIEVDSEKGAYRTLAGAQGAKITTSDWTYCEGKNVGRSNETTPAQQAMSEALAHTQKKKDKGYWPTIEEAKAPQKFNCMKAERFEEWQKDWTQVVSQPKLDGFRCNMTQYDMLTRGHEPIVTCPHIFMALQNILEKTQTVILDGELYNHAFKDDFNSLSSMIKREKLRPGDLEKAEKFIEYHVYDLYDPSRPDMNFNERHKLLTELCHGVKHVVVVPTDWVKTPGHLDTLYEEYNELGYEGQMVRIIEGAYEQKRSDFLLKRKPYYDAGALETEFEIVELLPGKGNWAGKARKVVCKLPSGETFRADIKATMAQAKEMLEKKDSYVGKMATVRYQNLTPDGVPRFPKAIDMNRGSY